MGIYNWFSDHARIGGSPRPSPFFPLGEDVIYSLLWDNFTDALGVGAVNGTPAVPGPGTRGVRDSENHLTLAGGLLTVDGGCAAPDYNDPSLCLKVPAVVREAGRVMLSEITQTVDGRLGTGWFSALPPLTKGNVSQWENAFYCIAATSINAADKGAAHDIQTTLRLLGTSYQYAVVLKATGAYYFIKGGLFTYWTLLMMIPLQSASPLYPGIIGRNAVFTSTFLRSPAQKWLPTPSFYDTFTRGNGALGNTEFYGPDAQPCPILPWTGATWTIDTNRAKNTPSYGPELAAGNLTVGTWYYITATQVDHFFVGCAISNTFLATAATGLDANNKVEALTLSELITTVNVGIPNVFARVKVHALKAGTQVGVVVRLNSAAAPTEFILFIFDGQGNIKTYEVVAGAYTQIHTTVKAFTADDELMTWVHGYTAGGGDIKTTHRTAAGVMVVNSMFDTTTVSNGDLVGIFSTDPTNTIEEADCFPEGAYGEHQALEGFVPAEYRQVVKYTPSVMFSFDDDLTSTYTEAYPYFLARGVKGTVYVITNTIGTGGHLTVAQLLELQAAGWTVGNHTRAHTNMLGRTQAQDEQDILDGYNDLIAIGITPANAHHLAYPGGDTDANALAAATAQGCLTGRKITGGIVFPLDPFTPDPLLMLMHTNLGNTTSLHTAENSVDRCRTNRELLRIVGHDLIVGVPGLITQWNITDFHNLVDYCLAEGLEFITMADAWARWHV